MLKKFFSNALLSVVMDKTARKRLETIRTEKEPAETTNKNKKSPKSTKSAKGKTTSKSPSTSKPSPMSDGDILSTITEALEEARKEAAAGPQQPATRTSASKTEAQRAAAIHQVLVSQKRSQTPPPKTAPPKAAPPKATQSTRKPTTEREKLIAEAMAIQKEKSRMLDDLDPKTRDKLMLMAQYTLDPDSISPEIRRQIGMAAKAERPVDSIGGARKPRRTPRK